MKGIKEIRPLLIALVIGCLIVGSATGWYYDDWLYRKQITIDHARVDSTLTDFPVLLSIVDTDIGAKAKADGSDIMITEFDEMTKVDREIEKFRNDTLVLWFRANALSNSSDDIFYIYYGNADASESDVASVWNSGYFGVWHLEETGTGARYDATSHDNDGTTSGYDGDEATGGKIDGADDFDNTNDFINCGNPADFNFEYTDTFSISVWIKREATGSHDFIIMKHEGLTADHKGYGLWINTNDNKIWWDLFHNNGASPRERMAVNSATTITDANWHHIVGTYDGSGAAAGLKIYIDGTKETVAVQYDNIVGTIQTTVELAIGDRADGNYNPFNGIIDEVRVADVIHGAAWVSTEYNNQNSPSTFYTLGDEQARGDVGNINYQAKIREAGVPIDTAKSIAYEIFDTASGGTMLWQQTPHIVNFTEGLFSDNLDITSTSINWDQELYLQVYIGEPGTTNIANMDTLSPRDPLLGSPHALSLGDEVLTSSKFLWDKNANDHPDSISAIDVPFDSSTSDITATNVKEAIDQLAAWATVIPGTTDHQTLRWDDTLAGSWMYNAYFDNGLEDVFTLINNDVDIHTSSDLRVVGKDIYGNPSADDAFHYRSSGSVDMIVDADQNGSNSFGIRDGSNNLVFEVTEGGNWTTDSNAYISGPITLTGNTARTLRGPTGAAVDYPLNISSASNLDLYIDDDNDGVTSRFYVKTDTVGDQYLFHLTESGDAKVYRKVHIEPRWTPPPGQKGAIYVNDSMHIPYYHNGTQWLKIMIGNSDIDTLEAVWDSIRGIPPSLADGIDDTSDFFPNTDDQRLSLSVDGETLYIENGGYVVLDTNRGANDAFLGEDWENGVGNWLVDTPYVALTRSHAISGKCVRIFHPEGGGTYYLTMWPMNLRAANKISFSYYYNEGAGDSCGLQLYDGTWSTVWGPHSGADSGEVKRLSVPQTTSQLRFFSKGDAAGASEGLFLDNIILDNYPTCTTQTLSITGHMVTLSDDTTLEIDDRLKHSDLFLGEDWENEWGNWSHSGCALTTTNAVSGYCVSVGGAIGAGDKYLTSEPFYLKDAKQIEFSYYFTKTNSGEYARLQRYDSDLGTWVEMWRANANGAHGVAKIEDEDEDLALPQNTRQIRFHVHETTSSDYTTALYVDNIIISDSIGPQLQDLTIFGHTVILSDTDSVTVPDTIGRNDPFPGEDWENGWNTWTLDFGDGDGDSTTNISPPDSQMGEITKDHAVYGRCAHIFRIDTIPSCTTFMTSPVFTLREHKKLSFDYYYDELNGDQCGLQFGYDDGWGGYVWVTVWGPYSGTECGYGKDMLPDSTRKIRFFSTNDAGGAVGGEGFYVDNLLIARSDSGAVTQYISINGHTVSIDKGGGSVTVPDSTRPSDDLFLGDGFEAGWDVFWRPDTQYATLTTEHASIGNCANITHPDAGGTYYITSYTINIREEKELAFSYYYNELAGDSCGLQRYDTDLGSWVTIWGPHTGTGSGRATMISLPTTSKQLRFFSKGNASGVGDGLFIDDVVICSYDLNVIQNLSISGYTISITSGGSVTVPDFLKRTDPFMGEDWENGWGGWTFYTSLPDTAQPSKRSYTRLTTTYAVFGYCARLRHAPVDTPDFTEATYYLFSPEFKLRARKELSFSYYYREEDGDRVGAADTVGLQRYDSDLSSWVTIWGPYTGTRGGFAEQVLLPMNTTQLRFFMWSDDANSCAGGLFIDNIDITSFCETQNISILDYTITLTDSGGSVRVPDDSGDTDPFAGEDWENAWGTFWLPDTPYVELTLVNAVAGTCAHVDHPDAGGTSYITSDTFEIRADKHMSFSYYYNEVGSDTCGLQRYDNITASWVNLWGPFSGSGEGCVQGLLLPTSATQIRFYSSGTNAASEGLYLDNVAIAELSNVGIPAGSDGQIQYNDNDTFAASDLYYDDINGRLGIGVSTPGGLLGLSDANTYIDVDGSNNLTFVDAVAGTLTLTELNSIGTFDGSYDEESGDHLVTVDDGNVIFDFVDNTGRDEFIWRNADSTTEYIKLAWSGYNPYLEIVSEDDSDSNATRLSNSELTFKRAGEPAVIRQVYQDDIAFYTDSTAERLRIIGSTGYVGIGTSTPTQMLDVAGNIIADTFFGDGAQLTGVLTAWDTLGAYWDTTNHFRGFDQDSIAWDTLAVYMNTTEVGTLAAYWDTTNHFRGFDQDSIAWDTLAVYLQTTDVDSLTFYWDTTNNFRNFDQDSIAWDTLMTYLDTLSTDTLGAYWDTTNYFRGFDQDSIAWDTLAFYLETADLDTLTFYWDTTNYFRGFDQDSIAWDTLAFYLETTELDTLTFYWDTTHHFRNFDQDSIAWDTLNYYLDTTKLDTLGLYDPLNMNGNKISNADTITSSYYAASGGLKLTDGVIMVKFITIADSIYFITATNDTFGPVTKK